MVCVGSICLTKSQALRGYDPPALYPTLRTFPNSSVGIIGETNPQRASLRRAAGHLACLTPAPQLPADPPPP